jgi:SAM-dependent methyltransferase
MSAAKATEIPGWFRWVDQQLFRAILADQADGAPGDVVELGTYLGKSAVLIGEYVRPAERFVAVDLFGRTDLLGDDTDANRREVDKSYKTLTRTKFEQNYLARHDTLPDIVEGPSSWVDQHVAPGSVRFCHIDASHLYAHVRVDAVNAARMLRPGGVVVFDDWRSEHTPGVTAAVWEAVFTAGLIPVVVTPTKFYGVFADPERLLAAAERVVAGSDDFWAERQEIAGHGVLRMRLQQPPKPAPPLPVDYDRVESVVTAALDRRLGRLEGTLSASLDPRLRRAALDASTITRTRRWLRGLARPSRA